MTRYYDKTTQTEVFTPSTTTIASDEGLIDWWFSPIASDEAIFYEQGIPYLYNTSIRNPKLENGVVVDGTTTEELEKEQKEKQREALRVEMNALLGDMTSAEAMMLMLRYGMAKTNPPSNDDAGTGSGLDTDLTPNGEDLIAWGDDIATQLVEKTRALRALK